MMSALQRQTEIIANEDKAYAVECMRTACESAASAAQEELVQKLRQQLLLSPSGAAVVSRDEAEAQLRNALREQREQLSRLASDDKLSALQARPL